MGEIIKKFPLLIPVFAGLFCGWLTYGFLVYISNEALVKAIRDVTAMNILIKDDPALEGELLFLDSDNSLDIEEAEFALVLAKSLGLVRRDDDIEKVSGFFKNVVSSEKSNLTSPRYLNETPAIQLVAMFAKNIGAIPKRDTKSSNDSTSIIETQILSRCIAGSPFAMELLHLTGR